MQQYMVGKKLMEFENIFFIAPYGNDDNLGTENSPLKTFEKASSILQTNNDAIVFLPGEYDLPYIGYYPYAGGGGTGFFFLNPDYASETTVIGQGRESVFRCDATTNTSVSVRDRNLIIGGSKIKFYRMNIKYKTIGGSHQSAIIHSTTPEFYNCAIENIGDKTMSVCYWNGGKNIADFYNCILKSNGKIVNDFTGSIHKMENTLLDWNYTNVTAPKNKLVREITEDDFVSGSAIDLITEDSSIIGVYGGDYTWGVNDSINTITEKYQDSEGEELKADLVKYVGEDKEYSATAPEVEDYTCIGYKIDDSALISGSEVVLPNVVEDHTVTFVYKKTAEIENPVDMNLHILMEVGEKVNLLGYILPVAPNALKLIWSSKDSAIASVDAKGQVTANKEGFTEIHVKTEDGRWSAFARIKVIEKGIEDLRLSILLKTDESVRLTTVFKPENTSIPVVWSSSDASVAKVDLTGRVTAVSEGVAIITVKTVDGEFMDFIYVTVNDEYVMQ